MVGLLCVYLFPVISFYRRGSAAARLLRKVGPGCGENAAPAGAQYSRSMLADSLLNCILSIIGLRDGVMMYLLLGRARAFPEGSCANLPIDEK